MQVTTIEARFMRRVQLRDYEPAEAEIKLTASLAEGEDFDKQHEELISLAKEGVRAALIGRMTTGKDASAAEVEKGPEPVASGTAAAVAEIGGAKRGRKSKEEMARIAAAMKAEEDAKAGKQNISTNPEDRQDPANPVSEIPGDEIPGSDPAPATKPATKPKADHSEIPGDDPAPAQTAKPAEVKGGITAAELQKWVSQQMFAKKLTAPEVIELMKSKGKDRMAELDPAGLVWLKEQLEAKVAAASL